jgi:hypothetical protein
MFVHSFTYTPLADSADFDADGDVDGKDFLVWQRNLGVGATNAAGDADYDGVVDAQDLAVGPASLAEPPGPNWRRAFPSRACCRWWHLPPVLSLVS